MRTSKEFESVSRLLINGARCQRVIAEISVETDNLFYENYGMSAEDVQDMLCRGERLG